MANTSIAFSDPQAEITLAPIDVTCGSPYQRDVWPMFKPTTLARAADGTIWEYGKATAAITVTPAATPAGLMVPVTKPTPVACAYSVTTGEISAGTGYLAHGSFAVGEYGWVQRNTTGI